MKKEILSLLEKIKKELNKEYIQIPFLKERQSFNCCYSAIWLIEDIEESFEYYKNCNDEQCPLGSKYLMIYGIFEGLYMQQCALSDLFKALNYGKINYNNITEINQIRNTRHDIAGHPTNRGGEYSTYLSRPDLSLKKIRYEETKNESFIDFDIISNIKTQEKFVKEKLTELLNMLKKEKQEHINTFKNIKLAECFNSLLYAMEKIYAENSFYTESDQFGFDIVENMLNNFKEKLNNRFYNWEKLPFAHEIKQIEEIFNYLISKPDIINGLQEDSNFLKINLLENMFHHLEHLKEIAEEIDHRYQNNLNI